MKTRFTPCLMILLMLLASAASAGPTPADGIERILIHNGGVVRSVVAIGQLNRIVLPFEQPEVRTLNPATTELQGRVLYLAPVDDAPVHLMIADTRDESRALTLSLTPREVSPREIQLSIREDAEFTDPPPSGDRVSAEPSDHAEDPVRQALKTLALGSVPEGYRIRPPSQGETIRCHQRNLLVKTRQVVEGPGNKVLVGLLKNTGPEALEVDEAECAGDRRTEAVATYPSGLLSKGKSIEIYLVLADGASGSGRRRRDP